MANKKTKDTESPQRNTGPMFLDESENPFYVFMTERGLKPHFFGMDEEVALDKTTRSLPTSIRNSLKLAYRIKNQLSDIEPHVVSSFPNQEPDKDTTKPWGFYLTFARNKKCTPKVLELDALGAELSSQVHRERDEIWFLVSGLMAVYRTPIARYTLENMTDALRIKTIANMKETIMLPGDGIYIPRETVHSARNMDKHGSVFVEVAIGNAREEDNVRLYDKSGRVALKDVPAGLSIPELIRYCRKHA